MARRRMIDPSIWDDEDVGTLSDGAFRLFIACISNADDEGRLVGSATRLRGIAYGFSDSITTETIDALLCELEGAIRGFRRYTVEGRQYIQLTHWKRYQTIDKPSPSKLPPPPLSDDSPNDSRTIAERSSKDAGTVGPKRREVKRSTSEVNDDTSPLSLLRQAFHEHTGGGEPGYLQPDDQKFVIALANEHGIETLILMMKDTCDGFKDRKGNWPRNLKYVVACWRNDPPKTVEPEQSQPPKPAGKYDHLDQCQRSQIWLIRDEYGVRDFDHAYEIWMERGQRVECNPEEKRTSAPTA